jgi:lipopolysaccharide export system permease protein
LTAATLSGQGKEIELSDVTWYQRGPGGIIRQQIRAPRATYAGPGWRLEQPKQFDVGSAEAEAIPTLVVGKNLTPDAIDLQSVDPDGQPFWELDNTIEAYKALGRRTSEMEAKWWHRISGPLSAFLMPLLGSIAAFGLARSGQLFVRAIIGMSLGFTYFVVDNAALAMGSFGGYPPFLAAWAPFLLFLLVGETVLIRTEE